jgi:hypothetical protein
LLPRRRGHPCCVTEVRTGQPADLWVVRGLVEVLAVRPDCGRFGEDRYTTACEERGEAGLGVVMIVTALLVAIGSLWWRHMSNKIRAVETSDPSEPRRSTHAKREAVLEQLRAEYRKKLDERDPDVLGTSRDWADNDGAPWRVEVLMSLAFLVLIGSVVSLIVFFSAIKALVDK